MKLLIKVPNTLAYFGVSFFNFKEKSWVECHIHKRCHHNVISKDKWEENYQITQEENLRAKITQKRKGVKIEKLLYIEGQKCK